MPHIKLIDQEFQPLTYVAKHQIIDPRIGAQAIFVGYMRDFREDNTVESMTITHYPPMTEQHLEKAVNQLIEQYQLTDLLVAHRIGHVVPTSPLVLIAATASHRANANQAMQDMLETLKYTAPFWKQEHRNGDSRWVEGNTDNAPILK